MYPVNMTHHSRGNEVLCFALSYTFCVSLFSFFFSSLSDGCHLSIFSRSSLMSLFLCCWVFRFPIWKVNGGARVGAKGKREDSRRMPLPKVYGLEMMRASVQYGAAWFSDVKQKWFWFVLPTIRHRALTDCSQFSAIWANSTHIFFSIRLFFPLFLTFFIYILYICRHFTSFTL